MDYEIRMMVPPNGTRKHKFCRLSPEEHNYPWELWLDLTDMRKKKGTDSAYLYHLTKTGDLEFDHYIRVSLMRQMGYR